MKKIKLFRSILIVLITFSVNFSFAVSVTLKLTDLSGHTGSHVCGNVSQSDYAFSVTIDACSTNFAGETTYLFIKFKDVNGAVTNLYQSSYLSSSDFNACDGSFTLTGYIHIANAPEPRDGGTIYAEFPIHSGTYTSSTISVADPTVTISPSSASINTISGPTSVTLTASASSSSFAWSPSTSLNTATGATVVCSAGTTKTYTVTATSTSFSTCIATKSVVVTVTGPCCAPSVSTQAFVNQTIVNTNATNYVTASGSSSLAAGASITINAGHYIEFDPNVLLDGTSANTVLLATIGGSCTYNTCRVGEESDSPASIINTDNSFSTEHVRVYPNPSSGLFTIDSDSPIDAVSVMNSLGNSIAVKPGSQIDLSNQPEGIYFISVSYKGKKEVKKVFKSK